MSEFRTGNPVKLLLLLLIALLVSCNQVQPGSEPATTKGITPFTLIPDTAGSAKLTYKLVVENSTIFVAADTELIPLKWELPPNDPEFALLFGAPPWKPTDAQPIYGTIENGSYFVQIEGMNQGVPCFLWFDIPVKYIVKGIFKPAPSCSFALTVSAVPRFSEATRGRDCPDLPGIDQYPVEILFISPPDQQVIFTGGALSQNVPMQEFTTLVLTLSDIVVAEATGCGGY